MLFLAGPSSEYAPSGSESGYEFLVISFSKKPFEHSLISSDYVKLSRGDASGIACDPAIDLVAKGVHE